MDFLEKARLARTPSEYAEEKIEIRADLRFCYRQMVESLSCLKEEDATRYTEAIIAGLKNNDQEAQI